MRKNWILKTVYEDYNRRVIKKEEIEKHTFDFINEVLTPDGWINVLIEGGFVSPDMSAIFYYARTPYEGMLIQYSRDDKAFEDIVNKYKKYLTDKWR